MRRAPFLLVLLATAAPLAGCRSSVVREHYIPTPTTADGTSAGLTRVRMAARGPDWSLGCMPHCAAMQTTLGSLAGQQALQALEAREAAVQSQTLLAQGVSRELDALLLSPAAQQPGNDAVLRLQAVNAICLGLGAPGPFGTLDEARAFLDRTAATQGTHP